MKKMNEEQLKAYMTTWGPGERHTKFAGIERRAWWNPMRYIRGEFYFFAL